MSSRVSLDAFKLSGRQEGFAKPLVFAMMVLSIATLSAAQQNAAQEVTDPMALLKAVAKNYASAADTFRLESITDFETSNDLNLQ